MIFSSINISEIHNNSKKFKGSNFLTKGFHYRKIIVKNNYKKLNEVANYISNIGINNRNYVLNKDFGYPFISNTILSNNDPSTLFKYVSKKLNKNVEGKFIEENMLLFAGIGSIGDIAFGSKDIIGCLTPLGNVIRVKTINYPGYFYAFFKSKIGNALILNLESGSVQTYLDPTTLGNLPVPILPEEKQQQIHQLIVDSANLRVEANKLLKEVKENLLRELGFNLLTNEEYEYFGNHVQGRNVSSFKVSSKEISSVSINAFNYSRRIKKLEDKIKSVPYRILSDCLVEGGYFSTGSFKRLEINGDNGIKLINQSDIFNSRKIGKILSRRAVGNVKLVEYGEVLIAGVGTLGEGETFCRTIFSNEELENQLVSGEFIRLKTNDEIPSGYLFAWLNTDYGFRLIRSTQSGTKLCRPIPELLKNIPVPILSNEKMLEIDNNVKKAHTDLFLALNKENQAINLIENEIDAWQ